MIARELFKPTKFVLDIQVNIEAPFAFKIWGSVLAEMLKSVYGAQYHIRFKL